MKQLLLLAATILGLGVSTFVPTKASACGMSCTHDVMLGFGSSLILTFASAPYSDHRPRGRYYYYNVYNDILQVQGDAAVAAETGMISPELQSVIQKFRQVTGDKLNGLTDAEVAAGLLTAELIQ